MSRPIGTDDDIHRYQGRWIEARGTVLPIHFRYIVWGLFLGFCTLLVPPVWLAAGPVNAAIFGCGLAGLATFAVADLVTPERPVRGWVRIGVAECRAWRTRAHRADRQVTRVHLRRVVRRGR